MFMDRNRRLNGAASPASVAREGASAQKASESLIPTGNDDLGSPQKRTFEPNLETISAISKRHKDGWRNDEFGSQTYERQMPVGPCMP